MSKLTTMCLNHKVSNCDVCKANFRLTFEKCVRLAEEKQQQLETFAKELYCDHISLMIIIGELEQKDQDLYDELTKFMNGEN